MSDREHRLYIGSAIDDAGLDVYEFRVLCRVSRRAHGGGECFESLPSIAKKTRMSLHRCRAAFASLIAKKLISRVDRPGAASVFTLRDANAEPLPDLVGVSDSVGVSDPVGGGTRSGRGPLPDLVDEGTPSKVLQKGGGEFELKSTTTGPPLPHGESFATVWADWLQFRKEKKNPLTATSLGRQLKMIGGMTERAAVDMIERSILNGWLGLFKPDDPKAPKGKGGGIVKCG